MKEGLALNNGKLISGDDKYTDSIKVSKNLFSIGKTLNYSRWNNLRFYLSIKSTEIGLLCN